MENMMTSIPNQIRHVFLSFNKNIKTLRKELVKQANEENKVIEHMGKLLYQPKKDKFDEGIGKREGRGRGANLCYNR